LKVQPQCTISLGLWLPILPDQIPEINAETGATRHLRAPISDDGSTPAALLCSAAARRVRYSAAGPGCCTRALC